MQTQHEWETAVVRDVVLKTATWNPAKEPRDTIRYVDVSAVSRERSAIEEATDYPANQAPGRARKIIHTNDTIFATIRPSLRRIAQVPEQFDNELASTAFCVLRPNPKKIDHDFLFHAVSSELFVEAVVNLETGASYPAVRDRDILDQSIRLPPIAEQKDIGSSLNLVRTALLHQSNSLAVAQELKHAAMRELFTKGLRGEPQKQTDIGPVPESWSTERLDKCADTISTRLPYTDLEKSQDGDGSDAVVVHGVKVSDMNALGNEVVITNAALVKKLPFSVAEYRAAPSGTIIFPKRGAAIATNKKRLTSTWTVFDPNIIGVIAREKLDQKYLFHWFQNFDLRTITEPGPTPQLNKKNLDPLLVPVPPTLDEQQEIASILDAIDRKIDLHKRKKAVLEELFKSLLHKLMTGEIRVSDLDLSAIQARGH